MNRIKSFSIRSSTCAFAISGALLFSPIVSALPDTDGDGIADLYELFGYSSGGATIDFPGMGASPYKKDIFVEADIMNGINVSPDAFQDVVDAFAKAPVLNPDGSSGINLHVDFSGSVPFSTDISFDKGNSLADDFRYPEIDVDASGNSAIAWQDDRDGNGHFEIYARRFDASGTALTNETYVNQESDGEQKYPDVGQDDGGDFVVVWQDDQDGNGYYQIYGRVFSAGGGAVTDAVLVNPTAAGQQIRPSVDMDNSSNWLAVWQDDRDGNGYYDIYARKFDRNGNALTGEFRVNSTGSYHQNRPRIAMAGDGRAVVVWEDDRDNNGYYEIYARRISAAGATTGSEIHVNTESAGQQRYPEVDINNSGNFVVAWQDDRDGNNYYQVYARRFNSNGSANGGEILINEVADGQQRDVDVAINSSGEFVVSWEDDQDNNGYYQILARSFNANGSARTGNRTINTVSADQQVNPSVGIADNGDYYVAYQDDRDGNDDWSIYMRARNHNGGSVTGDIEVHDHPVTFGYLKNNYFTDVRNGFYHYMVVANKRINSGSSGVAEILGDDLIVALGTNPGRTQFAGTFMHELGHNLDLEHGGNEGKNYKPNYMSVMRYGYQFWGADNDCDAASGSSDVGDLSYSLGRKFDLDEKDLNERVGICNGEKDVNWVSAGQQRDVDVAASDDGRFVVAWEDDRDGNGYYDVYVRPYGTDGMPLYTEKRAHSTGSLNQRDPAVGMRDDGRFVVVWEDDRDGNGYYEIDAQRFTSSGSRTGSEISVNADSAGNQRNPDIAVASDGYFVVAWEDDRDDNGYYEIYARLFNASGSAVTGDLHINQTSAGQQLRPRVAIADDHRFVVVWQDDNDGNGYYDIYARRYNTTGSAQGGEFRVNTTGSRQQKNPDVGIASDGRFVVVWQDDNDGNGYYQIHARRYNSSGSAYGAVFTVNQESAGQQTVPRVESNDDFEFAVVWQDDRDNNGYYEIYSRAYLSSGNARANEKKVNPIGNNQQKAPDLGIDSSGRFYVAWQDDRDGNGYYEIWGLRASNTGSRRDRTAIDWDDDGNNNESSVSVDINNADGKKNVLKDHNDWSNLKLNF